MCVPSTYRSGQHEDVQQIYHAEAEQLTQDDRNNDRNNYETMIEPIPEEENLELQRNPGGIIVLEENPGNTVTMEIIDIVNTYIIVLVNTLI